MRVTFRHIRKQPDLAEQFADAVEASLLLWNDTVDLQRFADDLADRHARVKRRIGILKDDLDLAAQATHLAAAVMRHVGSVE